MAHLLPPALLGGPYALPARMATGQPDQGGVPRAPGYNHVLNRYYPGEARTMLALNASFGSALHQETVDPATGGTSFFGPVPGAGAALSMRQIFARSSV